METIEVPDPISGGLMLSYRCTARCRHCMYGCSPDWNDDWMDPSTLRQGLSGLAERIVPAPRGRDTVELHHGLHFTGGEPFLNFELLCQAVEMAEEAGIPSTFVETNCFWARDEAETHRKLRRLRELGLKGIMISVNPFYAEHVPFERTQRAIQEGLKVFERQVMVYQQSYYQQFRSMGLTGTLPLQDYLKKVGKEGLTRRVEMLLMGRAARELRMLYPHRPADAFFDGRCKPAALRPWHNHFDNYGNYLPGYCAGISLGNWLELDAVLENGIDPEEKPVLAAVLQNDLEALLELSRDEGYETREEGYVSRCDLCLDARKHLAENGDYAELRPMEFYRQID